MNIPLSSAFFCVGCDNVVDSAKQCPACGSSMSLVPLSTWLGVTPNEVQPSMGFVHHPERSIESGSRAQA